MSRFIEKLNQITGVAQRPMGFKTIHTEDEKPRIQLIASISESDNENLSEIVKGADAVLLRITKIRSGVAALKNLCQALPDVPCGAWIKSIDGEDIKELSAAGADFVVSHAENSSLAILSDESIGKIMEIESSLSDGMLRAVNELSIDAVLMSGGRQEKQSLACHHVVVFQNFADILNKPLLVMVPSNVTAGELQTLWDTGVSGVVIEPGNEPNNGLAALREAIEKVTFSRRGTGIKEAILPHISSEKSASTEEDEE